LLLRAKEQWIDPPFADRKKLRAGPGVHKSTMVTRPVGVNSGGHFNCWSSIPFGTTETIMLAHHGFKLWTLGDLVHAGRTTRYKARSGLAASGSLAPAAARSKVD
jgi:hypothetical protein